MSTRTFHTLLLAAAASGLLAAPLAHAASPRPANVQGVQASAAQPRIGRSRTPRPAASQQAQQPAPNGSAQQAATQIEVLVLQGTNAPGGVAPSLLRLPQLLRPPFSVYSSITLLSRTTLPLGQSPAQVTLPNAGSASITSQGRLANGRYEVVVQLSLGGRQNTLQFSASPGDPFFTVRSMGAGPALILGFIVR